MLWKLLPILIALSCLVTIGAGAADSGSMRVLDSVEVDMGVRSIIFNRMETPVLKPQAASVSAARVLPEIALTSEELAAMQEWNAKKEECLYLACTVYDKAVTEVRWRRAEGEYVIWSGIDFNHLRSTFWIETEHSHYALIMGLGNESSESLDGVALPNLGASQYQIVKFPLTGVDPEVRTALDALHAYYNTNSELLAKDFEEGEVKWLAQEAWLREHPPEPKDTIINYFPIRSSYNKGGSR